MSAKTTEAKDLSRPNVVVKIPEVKLMLRDLAYLRGLTQPKSIRCRVSASITDKLRFLDLIARANVPPDAALVEEYKRKVTESVPLLQKALDDRQWNVLDNLVSSLKWDLNALKPHEDDVLTERGREILATGQATVRVRKVGCV